MMILSFKEFRRYAIRATDGDMGKVQDLLFDDLWWIVRYVVVDTGKWLPGRRVLISPGAAGPPQSDSHTLPVALTRDMVEKSPPIEADRHVSREVETEVSRYYGWPLYWGDSGFLPSGMRAGALSAVAEAAMIEAREPAEVGLRGAADVIDYHIQATDGGIGHVEDLLLDAESWAIRYLIVGTRNWLPGRKVLVAPGWVEKVSWGEASVYVDLTREQVRQSPTYDSSAAVDREYETRLYEHYGRPRYWT